MEGKNEKIAEQLDLLFKKYAETGQDTSSYLEGLLHSDYLNYWDYIQADVLLNLQTPRTSIPDEKIFILYHQITELYFKLMLHATEQIAYDEELTKEKMLIQLTRINSYWRNLVYSFEIMIEGMDKKQFLQFRMALLPASGFQSAQYRMVEICSTNLYNLVNYKLRENYKPDHDLQVLLDSLYWRSGATELATGKKTLTLKKFEEKYSKAFLQLAKDYQHINIHAKYKQLPESDQEDRLLIETLRKLDLYANVDWPIMHMKSAGRYLQRDPEDIKATGGTNWQKYLPPRQQRISFFPELFTQDELENWGVSTFATKKAATP